MARIPRNATGDMIYHVLNRANGRMTIFRKDADYEAFEEFLFEAKEKFSMRILAYCLMPNHWHFILYPREDNDLSNFMRWLTLTHTQRWNTHYHRIGYGHLYQGRCKSFPIQTDEHFLQVCRYVERNPVRANLVKKPEEWRWSSVWIREYGHKEQKQLLDSWPIKADNTYKEFLNTSQPQEELDTLRTSVDRGRPYGQESWVQKTAAELGLMPSINPRGRPRKQ